MSVENRRIFIDYTRGSMTEVLQEQTELFNAATKNGLILRAKKNEGDFSTQTMWAEIASLVKRRDVRGTGNVAALDLTELAEASVKVGASTPPVNIPPAMFTYMNEDPKKGGVIYGEQLAKARLADMLEVGIAAFVAALSAEPKNYLDRKAVGTTLSVLNEGSAKLGDAADRISAWLMHSTVLHDIYGTALANQERLFEFGNVRVVSDGFGRPLVMSDNASLLNVNGAAADVNSYNTCGLVAGGVMIDDNGDFYQNIETSNGKENIIRTIQSEWTYNTAVKGFAWDKTNGGTSPNTASIATAANWDRVATDHKNLAGVVIETRAQSAV